MAPTNRGRLLLAQGHQVRLMSAEYVRQHLVHALGVLWELLEQQPEFASDDERYQPRPCLAVRIVGVIGHAGIDDGRPDTIKRLRVQPVSAWRMMRPRQPPSRSRVDLQATEEWKRWAMIALNACRPRRQLGGSDPFPVYVVFSLTPRSAPPAGELSATPTHYPGHTSN